MRHSFLFEEGVWDAAGVFLDGGRAPRAASGITRIRHEADSWRVAGTMEIAGDPPLHIENAYRVTPPATLPDDPPPPLAWRSQNPALGASSAISRSSRTRSFRACAESGDGVGSETLLRLAPDRYRAHGVFAAGGAVLSTWSMTLSRRG